MSKNHVHTGPFIPEAAAMEMQGLQEMQADDGCVLSSGFIHPPVVTKKLAANVHKMNFLQAASFWNRLAFQLSAHDVYSFANGIKQSRGVASPRRNKIHALGFYLRVIEPTANRRSTLANGSLN